MRKIKKISNFLNYYFVYLEIAKAIWIFSACLNMIWNDLLKDNRIRIISIINVREIKTLENFSCEMSKIHRANIWVYSLFQCVFRGNSCEGFFQDVADMQRNWNEKKKSQNSAKFEEVSSCEIKSNRRKS